MSVPQLSQDPFKRALKLSNYDSQKEEHQNVDQNNQPSKESVFQLLNQNQEKIIFNHDIQKNNGSEFTHTEYTEKQKEINLIGKEKKIFKETFFNKYMDKKIDNSDQNLSDIQDQAKGKKPQRKPRGNPNLKRGAGAGGRGGRRTGVGRTRKPKQIKEVIVDDSKDNNQNQNGDSFTIKNGKRGKWKRKRLYSLKRTQKKKQKEVDQSDYQILHIQSVELIPKRKKPGPKRNSNKIIQIQSSGSSNEKILKKTNNTYPISTYSSSPQNQGSYYQTKQEMDDYQKFLLLYLMQKTTGLNGMLAQMILKSSLQDITFYFRQNKSRIYDLCEPFCEFYRQNPSAIKQIKLQNCQYGQHIKGFIKNYLKNQKKQHITREFSQQRVFPQKQKIIPQKTVKSMTNSKVYVNYNSSPSNQALFKNIDSMEKKGNKFLQEKQKENNVPHSDIQESVKQEQE